MSSRNEAVLLKSARPINDTVQEDSDDLVTSGAVYTSVKELQDNISDYIVCDDRIDDETESTKPVSAVAVKNYVSEQDFAREVDSSVTSGSIHLITSGAVKTAIDSAVQNSADSIKQLIHDNQSYDYHIVLEVSKWTGETSPFSYSVDSDDGLVNFDATDGDTIVLTHDYANSSKSQRDYAEFCGVELVAYSATTATIIAQEKPTQDMPLLISKLP